MNAPIREKIGEFTSLRGLSAETTKVIENAVMLVLLGLIKKDKLIETIQKYIELKDADAQSLSTKIDQLLSPLTRAFKELERKEAAQESLSQPNEEGHEALDRDALLAEIENPVPGEAKHEKMGPSDSHPVTVARHAGTSDPYRETI